MLKIVEILINRALALDPDARARLGELEGRVIRLRLRGGEGGEKTLFECDVLPAQAGLRLRAVDEQAERADVVLGGNAAAFARAFLAEAVRPALPEAALEVRGDVELARRFEQILKALDPDWEEGLARLAGDVIAHRLGRLARMLRGETRRAAHTLALDLAEYLREEARVAAPRARVEAFLQAVDRLRADADRLEARLERLWRRRPPPAAGVSP